MESGAFSLLIPLLCLLGLAEVTGSNQENQQVSIHDYCIVGAGPAGLQLGYFLKQAGRDYIIYDKADRPGSFFVRYPRHRMLISINKRFTGRKNRIFNERHDWNSLLSHDDSLRFPLYSDEFFPQADVLVKYLEDYQKKLGINVQFNTEVKNIVRLPPDVQTRNGTTFFMQDQHGNPLGCRVLIMATGWSQPKLVHFPGSEYVENYNDFDVNPRKYEGKSVLIIGRGKSW
ncbi:unnamed protein product [Darwinula stevensoni]|uniref:Uncharacterized protein n=1 Tax=Darwinula stevensoni TaxID=69355 RepID=A0A7R8WZV5_9CRUS|nr:unnamed protein product [Darwinula stevensoni]CAG0880993.1 unnamed protein product [Darwinula stevensoni]